MGLVDPAGTLQSGTSLTLDTDGVNEGLSYGLLFLVGYDGDGVYIDSCADVRAVLGKTWEGLLAAEKLTGVKDLAVHNVATAVQYIVLRSRFVSTGSPGPYLVKTSSPLSRDDLEKYLRSLDKAALKSFLQKAEI